MFVSSDGSCVDPDSATVELHALLSSNICKWHHTPVNATWLNLEHHALGLAGSERLPGLVAFVLQIMGAKGSKRPSSRDAEVATAQE